MSALRIALAQQDFPVGDVAGNGARMAALAAQARDQLRADLVVFPELALCGYPPEDLLLRPSFLAACAEAARALVAACPGIDLLFGLPVIDGDQVFNAAWWARDGRLLAEYRKQALPNYNVFDEKRYFSAGAEAVTVDCHGLRCGVLICEDFWVTGPPERARARGADLLLVLNASPYDSGKAAVRETLVRERAQALSLPVVYLNLVGGQDDLLFDGGTLVGDADGRLFGPAPSFVERLDLVIIDSGGEVTRVPEDWLRPPEPRVATLYRGLVRALSDYVRKNGFREVLLGLSGGIDSALTLAIAVDALGPERVHAVMMPSRYTSELSLTEAAAQAGVLTVDYRSLPITSLTDAAEAVLAPSFLGREPDVTEENLQSRARGLLLMALSNKLGWLLLSTGNKSEMAAGYATLYGDMCGGFAPLKDVYKTEVFALARHRNQQSTAIPEAVITRPPSAELAPNQTDQDSLPPYEVLDAILKGFIEEDLSVAEIAAQGIDVALVRRVVAMVLRNEYKRRQSAPGPRVSRRAFGRDRRYPISSGWKG